ncbi:hypothetical protein CMV_001922 [Castanea mollissima]|uniref:Uncharacterized protein n=1 Tax=Castanea mollissima TaxID=60419 RepID=A0A8J4W421_9ROSI|nr:hypothetical protein CMV_001922 [Castanea mollissima]
MWDWIPTEVIELLLHGLAHLCLRRQTQTPALRTCTSATRSSTSISLPVATDTMPLFYLPLTPESSSISVSPSLKLTALSEAHRRWVVDCAPASWIEVAFRGLKCLLVDRSGGFRRIGVSAWWASWWVSASRRGGLRGVFRHLGMGSGVSAWWVSASRCGFRRIGVVGFGVPAR